MIDKMLNARGRGLVRRLLKARVLAALPILVGTTSCVQLKPPDRPIEINLNINIRQEVVVKLQQDVRDLMKKNPGVF